MSVRDVIITNYYKNNYGSCVKSVYRRVGSTPNAEDVVQDAFTKALQYWGSYNQKEPFEGWFITILNNCCRDYVQKERLGGAIDDISIDELTEELTDESPKDYPSKLVRRVINESKPRSRDILTAYFFKDMPPADISNLYGVANKTIRMCIYRFKSRIKRMLSDKGI